MLSDCWLLRPSADWASVRQRTAAQHEGRRMGKPTILTVDDDPQVSAAITRDLAMHYGADYRLVRTTSGAEALTVLAELALRDRTGGA